MFYFRSMKKCTNLLSLFILTAILHACINPNCVTGVGSIENDRREIGDFDAIELRTDFDVIIKERVLGDNTRLEVKAQNNLLAYIKTTVEGGRLIIDTEGCIQPTSPIEIYVKANEIKAIQLSGSGEIFSKNTLHADKMALSCDGSGSIDVRVKADDITIANSASGLIKLDGKVSHCAISLSGSGEIDASSMKSDEADAVLSGSGTIKVHASEKIALNHSGSGTIQYSGNPKEKSENSTGSGSIIRQD